MSARAALAILLCCSLAACGTKPYEAESLGATVDEWQHVDPTPLNDALATARAEGEEWVDRPGQYVVQLFEVSGLLTYEASFTADRVEAPSRITLRLIRDGLLDDAVRGDVHVIDLRRHDGAQWRVVSHRRAMRCWRTGSDRYVTAPCP